MAKEIEMYIYEYIYIHFIYKLQIIAIIARWRPSADVGKAVITRGLYTYKTST